MIKNITYNLFLLISLFSCSSGNQEIDQNDQDSKAEKIEDIDNDDEKDNQETITRVAEIYDNEEQEEAQRKIEKEYGVQWDFCTCIVKNDSVDKAIGGEVSDADLDFLLERLEFIDEKCKGMLIQPNSTPEERNKHENKVRKCLKANK